MKTGAGESSSCTNVYSSRCQHADRHAAAGQKSSGHGCQHSSFQRKRAPVSFFTTLFAISYISFGFKMSWSQSVAPGNDFMEFDMTSTTKCIMEDISQNVIVVGNYAGIRKSDRAPVYMTVKVTDPKGKVLYNKSGQEEAQFAFTATSAGDYRACFSVDVMEIALATTIRLDWKTGVAATNWDDIAKKENLDLMATELRKLEQVVKEIHEEMLFFRTREEEMRNLNEATNDRVAFFSVCSLLVCIGLGAWQLWHLKSFFQRKKLL